jgi:antibiotic biosynthesis monooxygenase (ABM) superfamily enzyme
VKSLIVPVIRRHPVATAAVWTTLVLVVLALYFVTPTYLEAIFRR